MRTAFVALFASGVTGLADWCGEYIEVSFVFIWTILIFPFTDFQVLTQPFLSFLALDPAVVPASTNIAQGICFATLFGTVRYIFFRSAVILPK